MSSTVKKDGTRIKICGLFRDEDIEYANEARPDYAGFVFAPSKRQVTPALAGRLSRHLRKDIIPVGVFVDTPIADIIGLYFEGAIAIAQLHGTEDEAYITKLKLASSTGGMEPIQVIKTVNSLSLNNYTVHNNSVTHTQQEPLLSNLVRVGSWSNFAKIEKGVDYYLVDPGAGSGKKFNWNLITQNTFSRPWFLAGGVNAKNVKQAMALRPFAVDVSSGVETEGVKDRKKMVQITSIVRTGNE